MTRQEAVERWQSIAKTVFHAEAEIIDGWKERLHQVSELSKQERDKLMDEYTEAIAIEILSRTSDEELAEIE